MTMAITDDDHDSNAFSRDFIRLPFVTITKGDIPGHLSAILTKCVRHPTSDYAEMVKQSLPI